MEALLIVVLGCTPSLLFLLGMIALSRSRLGFQPFEPITFVALNTFMGITARSIYMAVTPLIPNAILLDAERETLVIAQLMATGVTVTFLCGYFISRSFSRNQKPLRWFTREIRRSPRTSMILLIILGLSLVGMVLFAQQVGFSAQRLADFSSKRGTYVEGIRMNFGYSRWLASLCVPVFLISLITVLSERQKRRLGWMTFLCMSGLMALGWAMFISSRTLVIVMGLQAIMATVFLRGAFGNIRLAVLASVRWGAPVLAIFLIMAAMRANKDSRAEIRQAVSISETIHKTVGSANFFGVAKTSIALKQIPEHVEYLYGASLTTWLTAPVPRSLWPEKPSVGLGFAFGEEVLGYDMSNLKNGKTISLPVELYWNFGWVGSLGGMFIFGVALGRYYELFRGSMVKKHTPAIVLYIATVYPVAMLTMSTNLSTGVVRSLQEGVTLCVLLMLVTKVNRPGHTGESS